MDKQIRIISVFATFLIIALMVSTTYMQFFDAQNLADNGYNSRSIYQEFSKARGSILAKAKSGVVIKVAYSDKTDDAFKYQRVYDNSKVWAPITGFYSIANRQDRGIEAALNAELNGDLPQLAFSNFFDMILQKEKRGADINLTVNPALQSAAYQAIEDSGYNGAIVAIEPKTGRVLALATYPSVDYNAFAVHDTSLASKAYSDAATNPDLPMSNRALTELYPPGSTFKVVTSATALETGNYTPDSIVPAPVTYTLPGTATALPNYAGGNCHAVNGQETITRALEQSCNTAFAMLGVELGSTKMLDMAKKFGFNQSFTIAKSVATDAFAMTSSVSQFPEKPANDRLAMSSIGQGDTIASPLQDASISATVANGGQLMSPYIVDSVSLDDKTIISNTPQALGAAIDASKAKVLQDMMVSDVANGIASDAAVKGVKVAGKTGTAENDPTKDPHAWFTGFAPADDPQIAVAVFLENGGVSHIPSRIAAALFKEYLNG